MVSRMRDVALTRGLRIPCGSKARIFPSAFADSQSSRDDFLAQA